MHKRPFGDSIEALVCDFLEQQDLSCVTKNFSCRLGEIDLVMLEPSTNTLVFVEVRFRASAEHGSATESVDWRKQRKLKRTVLHYLQRHADARQRARIDVVGVSYGGEDEAPVLINVSTHQYLGHQLIWTQNAIEE